MSSKSRGSESVESDWYATPAETTRAPLRELAAEIAADCPGGVVRRICEPTAGKGAIVKVLREFFPHADIVAHELDRTRFNMLNGLKLCEAHCGDYAETSVPANHYDLSVINPPFTIARSIVEKAHIESRHTLPLLRLGFLSSAKRKLFWRKHPADLLPLSFRPSFAASLSCIGDGKKKVKANGCGWGVIQDLEAERTKVCPACTGKVNVTTADSADYLWAHMWDGARPVRILSKS